MARRTGNGAARDDAVLLWQLAVGLSLLAAWEAAGRLTGSTWISRPSLVGLAILRWLRGDLYLNVAVTVTEVVVGVVLGALLGVLAGLVLGRSRVAGVILRPVIVALYSVPLVALAPLFIMFFGVDLMPKIVLVTIVVFFLLFFNTFAGVERVDADLVAAVALMGGNRREQFQKIVLPAAMVWIIGGVRVALPYALVGATTGEMLAARHGLGFLLADAASRFDMTDLYAALFILMLMGLAVAETATRLERYLLRWRDVAP